MDAIWDKSDKDGFMSLTASNKGQICNENIIGKFIYDCAMNENYSNFLEIGTWNGLGSTRCFVDGFNKRTNSYKFYSLECNPEKCHFAKNLYKNYENVHILNEVLLNNMPEDIYGVFPQLLQNPLCKHWNDVDFGNMKNKNLFFQRTDIPTLFDVILLDGGEYTTWYEFFIVKDKCKILLMDDTNVAKCDKIISILKNDPKWKCLFETNERNGTAGFMRVDM